jgi:2'-5' RNA ligase
LKLRVLIFNSGSAVRAFIAIDLPPGVRSELQRLQSTIRSALEQTQADAHRGATWVRPEGIHLTLKFLGEVPSERLAQVVQAMRELPPFAPFAVEVKGLGGFPGLTRPRVLWVGIEPSPELAQLARRVEEAVATLGFPRESRPFTPHLTLARFKTPRPLPRLGAIVERQGEQSLGRFEVNEFFLFESKLSPHGAEYRKVERFNQG